ncbi:hypothetical protein [Sciscionella sediminilitoris]|uniref:hypothetical protein n=1 Tax=Sciscionella sediminilitoris TaxID=1445613 RepID=UPI00068F055C|nr:hypothetical protein [Sciscionella sp. SE31]
MTESTITGPARDIEVPEQVRARSGLARFDYQNAVCLESAAAADRTALQWIRAILEGAEPEMRAGLRNGWTGLGVRLGPIPSDEHVFGWRIGERSADVVLLGADTETGLRPELFVQRTGTGVVFGSFMQFDTERARDDWSAMVDRHAPVMRRLLEYAVARVETT